MNVRRVGVSNAPGRGEIITLEIHDISDSGQGVGRYNNLVVFTEGAVPGDVVSVRLEKVKSKYAIGTVEKFEKRSDKRRETICKYAGLGGCGGCTYAELSYDTQLEIKAKQIRDKLVRLGGLENPNVADIIGMENPFNYRNKAQLPIAQGGRIGFFKGKSHDVVEPETCALQMPPVMAITEVLREFIKKYGISVYDEKSGKGVLRHVVVKTAANTGEVMVIIVAVTDKIPCLDGIAEAMDEAVYNLPPEKNGVEYSLESIIININNERRSEVLGKKYITAYGKPTITEKTMGMEFEISPLAFYQVNPMQMEKLYGKVLEYAELKGEETIFDIYCGIGTIGLICAKEMEKAYKAEHGKIDYKRLGYVYGVESVKQAVLDANRNAVINGIVNARYITGKAENVIGLLIPQDHPAIKKNTPTGTEEEQEECAGAPSKPSNIEKVNECQNQERTSDCRKEHDAASTNGEVADSEGNEAETSGASASEMTLAEALAGRAAKSLAPDIVILDPPRAGCDDVLLRAVAGAAPQKIIYVSCNPATLARDIKLLRAGFPAEEGGTPTVATYNLVEATPVDMFPHTGHIETCVLLVRECANDDEMVSIMVDLEGISLNQGKYEPAEKPTYGNIKKWIKEKYGFNVTNLYIGQIKDKVGMEKRKNYNIGSGEGRVPNCPEEKEKAIMEAFKHFGLI